MLSCLVSLANLCCHSSFCRVLQASRATKDRPVHRSVSHHRASLPHQENLEAARHFALRITSACVCACARVRVQGIKGDSGPSGAVGAKGEPVLKMQKPMHSFFSMLDNICYSHVNIISKGFQGSPGFPGPPVCMKLPPGPVYSHL